MKRFDGALHDTRYALRGLRRTPVATTVAVLSLALGMGATTAVFTLANVMLLKPLPYPEPDRLVVAFQSATGPGPAAIDTTPWSFERYQRLVELVPAFETVGFAASQDMNIRPESPAGVVERVRVETVSASAIEALGVKPQMGRKFQPDEDRPGTPYTAGLVSYRLWQRNVADLGEIITLNGAPVNVIGIMPKSFTGFASGADVWIPVHAMPRVQSGPRWTERLGSQVGTVIARLRADATMSVADAQLKTAAQTLNDVAPERFGPRGAHWDAGVIRLQDARRHPQVKPLLRILVVAVGAVLLIVCANLAGLLLARAHARSNEVRIRLAIGARRDQIVRQMLTESVVLASLGALPGLAIAYVGAEWLARLRPQLPQTFVLLRGTDLLDGVSLLPDWRTVTFIAGLTVVAGLAFGCVPALVASRARARLLLAGDTGGSGRGASLGRSILVVAQVALATMLLIGAGLMARSFHSLVETDLGFDPADVLIVSLSSSDTSAAAAAQREEGLDRLADLPLIEAVATHSCVPFNMECMVTIPLVIEGQSPQDAARASQVQMHTVSGDYFGVMRIPLLEGRSFGPAERRGTPPPVVLSESAARRLSTDGRSVVGLFVQARGPSRPPSEVIGVVGDMKFESIEGPARPALYFGNGPAGGGPQFRATLYVRSKADGGKLLPLVSGELRKADPSMAVTGMATGQELVAAAASSTRFVASLLGGFAVLALFLAAIGIYGVVSYIVMLRTRDYGIRIAIGATAGWVLTDVAKHGFALAATGVAFGIGGALGTTSILTRFLYEVTRGDITTYAGVMIVVTLVGGAAALIPAWRTMRVDPAVVLRT